MIFAQKNRSLLFCTCWPTGGPEGGLRYVQNVQHVLCTQYCKLHNFRWSWGPSHEIKVSLRNFCLRDSLVSLRNVSARLARSKSCYEISFCETRKKRYSQRHFLERLAFRDSRYEISICETHEKRVSLLNLTHESRENLARILGLRSESRENFKKWFSCQP